VKARCGGAARLVDLRRSMSVVKRRCRGPVAIAQVAGAIDVPVVKYFIVVGSALAVLLRIAGWSLPPRPASFPDQPEIIERASIRIRSAHAWPEKIVLDTNQPMIPPPAIEVAQTEPSVARPPEEMADQTGADSLAGPNPDARLIDAYRPSTRVKRRTTRSLPSAHVARTRTRNEEPTLRAGEECCWAEWTDRPAISKGDSLKRLARHDSGTGWHFPGGD
jgi:hypothetical protein